MDRIERPKEVALGQRSGIARKLGVKLNKKDRSQPVPTAGTRALDHRGRRIHSTQPSGDRGARLGREDPGARRERSAADEEVDLAAFRLGQKQLHESARVEEGDQGRTSAEEAPIAASWARSSSSFIAEYQPSGGGDRSSPGGSGGG